MKLAVSRDKAEQECAPIRIGNCCYIGGQTVIAKGATIGYHSVIGACSFVNRDVPRKPVGRVELDETEHVALVLHDRK